MFSAISAIATLTALEPRMCSRPRTGLVTLLRGGPLAVGVLGGTPDTYHTAGLGWGTATSTSTRPGTTSRIGNPAFGHRDSARRSKLCVKGS
jgi:hypothetical protein